MKKYWHKATLWLMAFVALVSLIPTNVFAVSGTVYFGPDGNTVTSDSEFYVEVRGNVPDPGGFWGGGGTIRFTYDPTKLQLISADDEDGVFRQNNNHDWNTSESGIVYYRAQLYFNTPGVNNQKIIGARFKAIGTGSTTLNFSPSTNVNDGPTTGTPKTFTILPKTCPSGQTGTPPNCTTPPPPAPSPTTTPTTKPVPTKTPTPAASQAPTPTPVPLPTTEVTPEPTIDNDGGLKVENVKTIISRQKNSITWSMNLPGVAPELMYGTTKASLKSKATVNTLSDGTFESTLDDIKPGTLYYFAIKANTPDQLKSANYNGSFTSKGYPVHITVKQNGTLAPAAKITINDRNFVSDNNATITAEFGEGAYDAIVIPKDSGSQYKASIVVKKVTIPQSGEPAVQNIVLDGVIKGTVESSSDNPLALIIGVIAGATGLGGLIAFAVYRRKHNESLSDTSIDSDLLITNYGNAIDDSRAQTPEPNLDVQTPQALTEPLAQAAYDQSYNQQQQAYDDNQQIAQQYGVPVVTTDESIYTASQQPAEENFVQNDYAESLPQQYDASTVDTQVVDTETSQILDEQLSDQLIAVESINNDNNSSSDFEEAIYHPETGELDILHNTHSPSQSPSTPEPVDAPMNDSVSTSPEPTTNMSSEGPSELYVRTVSS